MGKVERSYAKGKLIFVGMDVHKRDWVITVLCQGEELYHGTVVPDPEALIRLLRRFEASKVFTVYEAGPTGYWLHDALVKAGFDSMVTPAVAQDTQPDRTSSEADTKPDQVIATLPWEENASDIERTLE